jgi:hypothetical protein
MSIQYYMRAYKTTATAGFVDWISDLEPDLTGGSSGYNPSDLINISINYKKQAENLLELGTNPADIGIIRLPNDSYITARNSANDGNITFIALNTNDVILFGDPIAEIDLLSSTIYFDKDVTFPSISQSANTDTSGVAQSLTISAQDANDGYGGDLNLDSGYGNYESGVITFSVGGDQYGVFGFDSEAYFSVGDTPAQSSAFRVNNNVYGAAGRNADDSLDIPVWIANSNNVLELGTDSFLTAINGINVSFFAPLGSFGGGSRVIFLANASVAPISDPTGGGILYVEGGALKFRGSSGTITSVAPA